MQIQVGSLVRLNKDIYHHKKHYKQGEVGVVKIVDHYRLYCDVLFIGHLEDWGFDVADVDVVLPGGENVMAYYK